MSAHVQAKKSISSHLGTLADFAIEMFDVLDEINYQSYNDFVLRVGTWPPPSRTRSGLAAGLSPGSDEPEDGHRDTGTHVLPGIGLSPIKRRSLHPHSERPEML